jgi:drug/metabolite transporter (DMT)-like permease
VFYLGLGAALGASALFNVGVALQGLEARQAPRELGLRLSLIRRLLRRRRWVVGLLLGLIGVGPQVVALANAPFVVVQPALASGLLLLLLIGARVFRERVTTWELTGVAAIITGVALVAWGAPPHSETHRGAFYILAVVGALSALALVPFPIRGTRLDWNKATVVAAGCGFAAANVVTKLMSDDVGSGHYVNAAGWAAAGVVTGVAATLTEMTAFQRFRATMVVPVVTSVQTFLPILVEPLFLRERWASADYGGAPIAVGILLALAGTAFVSRTRAVSGLAAGA